MHGGGDRVASPPGVPPRPRPGPVAPCRPPWRPDAPQRLWVETPNAPGDGRVLLRVTVKPQPDLYRPADGAHRPRRPPPPDDRRRARDARRVDRARTAIELVQVRTPGQDREVAPAGGGRGLRPGRRARRRRDDARRPACRRRRPGGRCSASPAAASARSPRRAPTRLEPALERVRAGDWHERRLPVAGGRGARVAPRAQRPRDRPPRRGAGLRLDLRRRRSSTSASAATASSWRRRSARAPTRSPRAGRSSRPAPTRWS